MTILLEIIDGFRWLSMGGFEGIECFFEVFELG